MTNAGGGNSKTSSLACNPKDRQILDAILREVNLQPPWQNNPECSTRTFNYVLAALVDHPKQQRSKNRRSSSSPVATAAAPPPPPASSVGSRAAQVLQYMLQEAKERPAMRPNLRTLNTVLRAYTNTAGSSSTSSLSRKQQSQQKASQRAAESAYQLLQAWQEQYMDRDNDIVTENADICSYNTVISAFGKAAQPEKAQQVFDELQRNNNNNQNGEMLQPDVYTFNGLLNAYAVAGQTDRVGDLFRRMRTEGPPPTIHTMNDVLYAYSNAAPPSGTISNQAEQFLDWWLLEDQRRRELVAMDRDDREPRDDHWVGPNTQSYNIVLHAMGQTATITNSSICAKNVVERARKLFDRMPAKDLVSYTTMIKTSTKILSGKEALDAVESVLLEAWTDPVVLASSSAFLSNALYSIAAIDDKNMATFAESAVEEAISQHKVSPDMTVYNGLLHCWSKADRADSGPRVLSLLSQLEEDPRYQPDVCSLTSVIVALRGGPSENLGVAEEILQRMEEHGPKPTVQAYTALIMNYARSTLPNKAAKAAALLKRMKENGCRPNVISYNAVLNACEHTSPSSTGSTEEALKIACVIFDQVRRDASVKPNHVTYGTFLSSLGALMPTATSQQETISLVFAKCRTEGLVSKFVLRKLFGATETGYRDLLQGHSESQLPQKWTCNVRESRARDEAF